MLYVVLGDNQVQRRTHIATLIPRDTESIMFDDTQGVIADLEQYVYPSLFMSSAPVVHVKYMLGSESIAAPLLSLLLASPTMFIFEEITLPATQITSLKKAGAMLQVQEKIKSTKKEADIFAVTGALTGADKKKRWIAYREALAAHPIEAIMGILYWKLRDLSTKSKEKDHYITLYKELLDGHARAWEHGTPLDLVVEKILLTN